MACESLWDTREIIVRYVVRPAPDFKPMNVGLRKRTSFSATRTKHKASLDMLPCVSKQLPIQEYNSATPKRKNKDQTRQSSAVKF